MSMTKLHDLAVLPEDILRLASSIVAADPVRYPNIDAVLRAGVQAVARVERRRAEKAEALRASLIEGETSGETSKDVFDRVSAKLGLPPVSRGASS